MNLRVNMIVSSLLKCFSISSSSKIFANLILDSVIENEDKHIKSTSHVVRDVHYVRRFGLVIPPFI